MSLCVGISCEPVKCCEHGRPPLTCEWCVIIDLIKRVEKLESQDKNGHMFLRGQIDRLDEKLEKGLSQTATISVIHSFTQIHETWKAGCEVLISEMQKKIHELETPLEIVRALGSRAYHPKKPHKCPVCEYKPGSEIKITKTASGKDKLLIECHGCDGRGIVWG